MLLSTVYTFCKKIESTLWGSRSAKTIFECGDFNINFLKHENHSNTKHFLDTVWVFTL